MILVDDFSRMTWLYLLHNRSEVLNCFQSFCNDIYNQHSTMIKVLSTDNALEYKSNHFQQFLKDHGILRESSCAHNPQNDSIFSN